MLPINLNAPGALKKLADDIKKDIDDYCARTYFDGHRNHLGASIIGHDCHRYLWSVFRWLKQDVSGKDGRMQRLFNRGHREEERFIEWLRGIGFQIWDRNENGDQFRVAAVGGHFGGSLDGVNRAPDKYSIFEPMLCEFKTSGTGAGFNDLSKLGVKVAKPQHYDQMCTYGKHYGFRYALYLCINKNDDALYVEIVPLDWRVGEASERKATQIVVAEYPPPKISDNLSFHKCKFCTFAGICHENEEPERNCRSCRFAKPAQEGQWHCKNFNQLIPKDYIPKGCPHWKSVV